MRDEVPKRNVLQMFDSDEYFLVNIMVTNEIFRTLCAKMLR